MMLNAVEAGWLVAQLALVGGCAYVLWRGLFATLPPRKHARCGGCGYELNVIAGDKCPECGGEFLKVGIRRSGEKRRMRGWLIACALVWTLFAVWGTYFYAWGLIGKAMEGMGGGVELREVTSTGVLTIGGESTGFLEKAPHVTTLYEEESTQALDGRLVTRSIEVALYIEGPTAGAIFQDQPSQESDDPERVEPLWVEMNLEVSPGTVTLRQGGIVVWTAQRVAPEDLLAVFEAQGLPDSAVSVREQIPFLASAIQDLMDGESAVNAGLGGHEAIQAVHRPVIYLAANRHALAINGRTLLVVLIYLAGLVFIYRRWRSRVRTADDEAEAA